MWEQRLELMECVKNDLYGKNGLPDPTWSSLDSKALETISEIVNSIWYSAESVFKEKHPEYKTEEDEIFIPRKSFKENVTEALLEANQKFWNSSNDIFEVDSDSMTP